MPVYNSLEKIPVATTVFTTEHVPAEAQGGRRWIGTSTAVANGMAFPQLMEQYWKGVLSEERPDATLVVPVREGDFGNAVLCWESHRLMNREVGPVLGWPTSMRARTEILEAYDNWDDVSGALAALDYTGFVYLSVLAGETICAVSAGFSLPHLAIWWELQKDAVRDVMEWLAGEKQELRSPWEEEIAVGVLLHQQSPVDIPVVAQKHVWETGSVAWATARGADLAQARHRTFRAVNAVVELNPIIAYRTDFGWAGAQSEDTEPNAAVGPRSETPPLLRGEDQDPPALQSSGDTEERQPELAEDPGT